MSDEAFKTIYEFSKLPDTEEKLEISRQYAEDEISAFEFYVEAKDYLERHDAIK